MLLNRIGLSIPLEGLYAGQAAFLICSGPSLKSHRLEMLSQPGILTLAVNNAATVIRPQLWASADDPGNFSHSIWYDPGILKFVPHSHMEKRFTVRDAGGELTPSPHLVGDMPAVFGFKRNETFDAERWLCEDTFNWGNHSERFDAYGLKGSRSIMYIAIRLLYYLGIRKVFLLGCDFRMDYGKANYAFNQDRSRSSVRGNNQSYRILNIRLGNLLPYFERAGFQIFNCTPESGLTVFPHTPFEEAVEVARNFIPKVINTTGMYDRKARPATASQKHATLTNADSDDLPPITVVTAMDRNYFHRLKYAFPTWLAFQPWIRKCPILVIHDAAFDIATEEVASVFRDANVQFVAWEMDVPSQREKMLTSFVHVPVRYVQTPWYLKLDADTIARPGCPMIRPEWFQPLGGKLPAFISHPWGYTKPADAIEKLNAWGDAVPALREFPPLPTDGRASESRFHHRRIISWFFLGNTKWTREVASFAGSRLPCPSHDTYLFYCAARRNDPYLRIRMHDYGWEHISRFRRLKQTSGELLRTASFTGVS